MQTRQLLWAGIPWIAVMSACSAGGSNARDADANDPKPTFDTFGTADGALGPRADVVIASITSGDAEFLRERPALAAGKYVLMAADAFTFFRGSLALFLRDWSDDTGGLQMTRFPAGDARPFGLGDAHPENFGTMRTSTGIFRLEPNDFDTADRVPYLWDVRRFAAGLCLAARQSNRTDPTARAITAAAARSITRSAVVSYADTMRALAAGGARPTIESGDGNPVLDDLFLRSTNDWDSHAELDQLTVTDTVRQFVRGTPDPNQPEQTTRDLPARSRLNIAASIAGYRGSLSAPPSIAELVPLDAVQQFGQGIGSFPRVRALVLVRGPSTDDVDDVVLEIKELPPQGAPPLPVPTSFATPSQRLLAALAAGWTERGADPLWGVGTWSGSPAGSPVQIRSEASGFKTVRVSRLDGPQGTPAAVEGLGVVLARLIARMHAAPVAGASVAGMIAAGIAADPTGFADEQTDVALGYCDRVFSDWELFKQALVLLGPTLGVAGDPSLAATTELRVLYDPAADPRSAGVDPVTGPITINEISAVGSEYVEILNASRTSQSIAGFAVADADTDGGPRFDLAARFLAGATLSTGGRMVIVGGVSPVTPGAQSNCIPGVAVCYQAAWDISASRGETIYLLTPDNVIVDQAIYPVISIAIGQSWRRFPDGSGPFTVGVATPSGANTGP